MRKLLALVALVVLLVAVDRAAVGLASGALADQIAASGELAGKPDVTIDGFPFLTQALSGRYDEITVSAAGLSTERGVGAFEARLSGVQLPLSEALSGSVTQVPVDAVEARALLTFAELERRVATRQLRLSAAGDLVRVTGRVRVLGRILTASAFSSLRVSGNQVIVTAQRFQVGAQPADRALTAALGKRLDFRTRLAKLPYGLRVQGLVVRPDGVEVTATARGTVLTR